MTMRVVLVGKGYTVALECDVCPEEGVPATETLSFGLDRLAYELDACDRCAAWCRYQMLTMVGVARRAGEHKAPAPPPARKSRRDPAAYERPCPTCKARPGQRCTRPSGWECGEPHASRRRAPAPDLAQLALAT